MIASPADLQLRRLDVLSREEVLALLRQRQCRLPREVSEDWLRLQSSFRLRLLLLAGILTDVVRARLIVASNQPLDKGVEAEHFRGDLYYRLNVVSFQLPPLRERRSIIPHLAAHFIADFAARNSRPVHGITVLALRALQEYSWPGNLRELRNVIERAVALCPNQEIDVEDLPEPIRALVLRLAPFPNRPAEAVSAEPAAATLNDTRGKAELSRITQALWKHGNNRLRAAVELGISRVTLYKKLHKYGLMAG